MSLYQTVTDRIVADIEAGTAPWRKPWAPGVNGVGSRPLRVTFEPYSGINTLMLWSESAHRGYRSPVWMTYRQAQELGAQVRKGSKGSLVVYASKATKTETRNGEDVERSFSFLKSYTVFNCDCIEGLPERFAVRDPALVPTVERIAAAETFVGRTGAIVHHNGGDRAFYRPSSDSIHMPVLKQFRDRESYYGTLLHELTHWTGPEHRCARKFGARFGDRAYAAEELVAELGAAFLCADLGIASEPRPDHAAYLASWLEVMKADARAIFTAAAAAQRACEFVAALQTRTEAVAA